MSDKVIKICVLGNKDSKKEELINLFKQYGNEINNLKTRIYDFDFLFESPQEIEKIITRFKVQKEK